MKLQRDEDMQRAARLYAAVPGSPVTVAFADGADHVRHEWLQWARWFAEHHAEGLDAAARGHLTARISTLENP